MKLCHAAALALVGWHLISPPSRFQSTGWPNCKFDPRRRPCRNGIEAALIL
jgi:hypothetical protein